MEQAAHRQATNEQAAHRQAANKQAAERFQPNAGSTGMSVLGVVAIRVENRKESAPAVNGVLSQFGQIIVGRLGVPHRETGISLITVAVDGPQPQVNSLLERLQQIDGVQAGQVVWEEARTTL